MNKANVQKAIDVMTRVRDRGDPLDMGLWQHVGDRPGPALAEEELHTCGTSACMAGWIAVSAEWKRSGGTISEYGSPLRGDNRGASAIAKWLDISEKEGCALCGLSFMSGVYPHAEGYVDNITIKDVITALTRLRDTGSAFV